MTAPVQLDPAAVLADRSSSLSRIMKAVDALEASGQFFRDASIGISSNITIDLLDTFLRRHALLDGVKLRVHRGNFDDVVGDVETFLRAGVEHLLLLPFFDNLLPAFESQVGHLGADEIATKEVEVRARYRLALAQSSVFRAVFVGTFHRMGASTNLTTDAVSDTIARFNQMLSEEAARHPNVRLIDMSEIVGAVGQSHAFDSRFYFRAKAPYSTALLNELARRVAAASRGFGRRFFKALVLDCDNTLWGGLVGEDLPAGIQLDPYDYPGNIFWRIQHELAALEQAGVLLCLCSKNNPEDVDEVLSKHPNMVLRDRHFILKKVNWKDKCSNLREIAETLNVGLDSLVFLDDSDFECMGVRGQLPMVRTFQVPPSLPHYPAILSEIRDLFLAGGITAESRSKTAQYRQRAAAEELKAGFSSNEEFLASLQLRIVVSRDAIGSVPRISELTMKSNQFNLTTRRYSENDIGQLMENADSTVYSVVVSDKFGTAGLTGVMIVRWQGDDAVVDSFLMSCRVIGRGIEFAVWNEVLRDAASRSCRVLRAEYHATAKNAQVADFFDRLGLRLVSEEANHRRYEAPIDSFPAPQTPWIEVVGAD